MIKITIEGCGAGIVGNIVTKALRASGIDTNFWLDVTPREVRGCRLDAKRKRDEISVVAMREHK
jgi:hypothetical protein